MLSGGRETGAVCRPGRRRRILRASIVPVVAGLALLSGAAVAETSVKRGGDVPSAAVRATGAPHERRSASTSSGSDRREERALLDWSIHLSGYESGAPLPTVRYVPPSFFAEHACAGRNDCHVLGWYDDRHVVYVVEALRSLDSLFARSLLVHEFVHYLQHLSGRFATHDCENFVEREREAYAVQQSFFIAHGVVPQIRARHYACVRLEAAPRTGDVRLSSVEPDRMIGD